VSLVPSPPKVRGTNGAMTSGTRLKPLNTLEQPLSCSCSSGSPQGYLGCSSWPTIDPSLLEERLRGQRESSNRMIPSTPRPEESPLGCRGISLRQHSLPSFAAPAMRRYNTDGGGFPTAAKTQRRDLLPQVSS